MLFLSSLLTQIIHSFSTFLIVSHDIFFFLLIYLYDCLRDKTYNLLLIINMSRIEYFENLYAFSMNYVKCTRKLQKYK